MLKDTITVQSYLSSYYEITKLVMQQQQQENITITNNSTLAEYIKDCFLDIKTKSGLDGINVNKWIMILCYETYKGEGAFNHQLSEEQKSEMN